jgi:hypothetical protein
MPSSDDVQAEILAAMREVHPRPQTHAEMVAKLDGFAPAQPVRMNMVAMARPEDGRLEVIRDGSANDSRTKRYRLGPRGM